MISAWIIPGLNSRGTLLQSTRSFCCFSILLPCEVICTWYGVSFYSNCELMTMIWKLNDSMTGRFVETIDLKTPDPIAHKHIPYVVILVKMADEWAKTHSSHLPSTREEKREFKVSVLPVTKQTFSKDLLVLWVPVLIYSFFLLNLRI